MESVRVDEVVSVTNEEYPEALMVIPDDILTTDDVLQFTKLDEGLLDQAHEALNATAENLEAAQSTLDMLTSEDVAKFVAGMRVPDSVTTAALDNPGSQLDSSLLSQALVDEFDDLDRSIDDWQSSLRDIATGLDLVTSQTSDPGQGLADAAPELANVSYELPPVREAEDFKGDALKALESSIQEQLAIHGLDQPEPDDTPLAADSKLVNGDLGSEVETTPDPLLMPELVKDFAGSEARETLLSGGDMLLRIKPDYQENAEKPVVDEDAPEEESPSAQVFTDLRDDNSEIKGRSQQSRSGDDQEIGQQSALQQSPSALVGLSMLVGAVGVAGAKLFNVLGNGVEAGFDAWKDYRGRRNAEEYYAAFSQAEASLGRFKEGVVGRSIDSLPAEEHASVIEQLLAGDQSAAESLNDLINSMDSLRNQARKYVSHQIKSGEDPEIVIDAALKPIAKLTDENKSLLEKVSHNGQSLLDKMDGISNGLLNLVRDLINAISRTVSLNIGGTAAASPAPSNKGIGM